MLKLCNIIKEKRGVISIELAICFPVFLLMFIFVLEMNRLMFISSSLDLLTADVARRASITENINKNTSSYSNIFYNELSKELSLWPMLTSQDNFIVQVEFCNNIKNIVDDNCNTTSASLSKIIHYKVEYRYNAFFSSLFSNLADTSLKRESVVYREFQS